MARDYQRDNFEDLRRQRLRRSALVAGLSLFVTLILTASPLLEGAGPWTLFFLGVLPPALTATAVYYLARHFTLERHRRAESLARGKLPVLGMPPKRDAFAKAIKDARAKGKKMLDRYLVGFELDTGEPLWVSDDEICTHAAVFAKTGVGKTLWLESLMFQQMARGRASGCTFIDAKRDSATLAHVILMAMVTGRIEDLIVIDPFDPVHSYNFVLTDQRADVKARKVLRAGLPPMADHSTTKHYDRLAADSVYRLVRAFESFGLSWSIRDIATALSAFQLSYPRLSQMLHRIKAHDAVVELGHLASSYRTPRGTLDSAKFTDNLRGISSELHAIAGSDAGEVFCSPQTDLVLTDAILRGKIIYFMLPRLEEAESAARMIKIFREDLEVSIGEITSSRTRNLEDPHLVIIDEGASTFGPTWANLFELARRGRFGLIFGAQSTGGLTDVTRGLSEAFYERVMANVNLKVMMRVGDNRTAQDMAEWFGKVNTVKKSVGSGTSLSYQMTNLNLETRRAKGKNSFEALIEDEEDLVSTEELKHEMSAEKGLAWFDLGNGRIVKGRAFWFNAEVPETWEGREYLTRFERGQEADSVGLAEWVNAQILRQEQDEHGEPEVPVAPSPKRKAPEQAPPPPAPEPPKAPDPEATPAKPFKLSDKKTGRPRGATLRLKLSKPLQEENVEQPAAPEKNPPRR